MRSIIKISEWIKSRIKFDTDHKLTSGHNRPHQTQKHNIRRSCKILLTSNRRGHNIRIGNKFPRLIQRPKVICTSFPSLSPDKRSNIRCKPYKISVDSNSFTVGIENHASTTISNRSIHLVGTVTPVKSKMVKTNCRSGSSEV